MIKNANKIDFRLVLFYVALVSLFVGFSIVVYDTVHVGIGAQGTAGKAGEGLTLFAALGLMSKRGLFGISVKNLPSVAHQKNYLASATVSPTDVKIFNEIHTYLWHSGTLQNTKGRAIKVFGKIVGLAGTLYAIGAYESLESLFGISFGVAGNLDTIVQSGSLRFWLFWIRKVGKARDSWDKLEAGWKDKNPVVF